MFAKMVNAQTIIIKIMTTVSDRNSDMKRDLDEEKQKERDC